jgi:hypothetical protein
MAMSGCVAFEGMRRLASGGLAEVALAAKQAFDRGGSAAILIFDDVTGMQVDVDFSGSVDEVVKRLESRGLLATEPQPEAVAPRGPGRPKLGVVAHEVTLLPRHWEWLNEQPGGASVTLRKLVDAARHANEGKDRARRSREAAYRFISAMAGNLPDFEEASRALFAGDAARFGERIAPWPSAVRDLARKLAAEGLESPANVGV